MGEHILSMQVTARLGIFVSKNRVRAVFGRFRKNRISETSSVFLLAGQILRFTGTCLQGITFKTGIKRCGQSVLQVIPCRAGIS